MAFSCRFLFRVACDHSRDGRRNGERTYGTWDFINTPEYRWCQANCKGSWRCRWERDPPELDGDDCMLAALTFRLERDAALFKLFFWDSDRFAQLNS